MILRTRRQFALMAAAGLSSCQTPSSKTGEPREAGLDTAGPNRPIIVDLHCDTPLRFAEKEFDLGRRNPFGQVDIPRMREGGVSGVFFSVYTSASQEPASAFRRALQIIDQIHTLATLYEGDLVLCTTAAQIRQAHAAGKIAILLGIEGGHMINSSPALLRTLFELGARYLTLTHSRHVPWAQSSGEPSDSGLTALGRQIVAEMNGLGMMVDVSHVSDQTFFDVIATSSVPIIASHSSCRALANHPRNLTDEMLRALAGNGGVVHINYYNAFLDDEYRSRAGKAADLDHRRTEARKRLADRPGDLAAELRRIDQEQVRRLGRVPFSKLLDHFEHAAMVAGTGHVGLGSDFDGVSDELPEGMEDISQMPNLIEGLGKRGFSNEDIRKILGENTLRVMRQAEDAARPNRDGTAQG